MEISSLSDTELKTLVIRMLAELTGYGNSTKKTQAEMKVALSGIKKNPQATNNRGDEAKIPTTVWNIREKYAFNQNSRKT